MKKSLSSAVSTRSIWILTAFLVVVGCLILMFHGWVTNQAANGAIRFPHTNIFYVLFLKEEYLPCFLVVTLLPVVAFAWARYGKISLPEPAGFAWLHVLLIAAAAFVCCYLGAVFAYYRFPLSMDEYLGDFQAEIFLMGQHKAVIPEALRPLALPMTPVFVAFLPEEFAWITAYWPGYAGFRAFFALLGDAWLCNAFFAALAVVGTAGIARKLFPNEPAGGFVAAVLVATSPQFLINGMSGYPLTGYVALNVVWLWCWLSDKLYARMAAPVVGVICLAFHQPTGHTFFVLPFLIWMLFCRRKIEVLWAIVVYGIGLAGMYVWYMETRPDATFGRALQIFSGAYMNRELVQAINLSLLYNWSTPPLLILFFAGLAKFRKWSPEVWCLFLGIAIAFAFFVAFRSDQGHGWGYRYLMPLLANVGLIAIVGARSIFKTISAGASKLICIGSLGSLVVLLPPRIHEIEKYVFPFHDTYRRLRSADADFMIIPALGSWYASDLVRNSPAFSQRPIFLMNFRLSALDEEGSALLRESKTLQVRPEDLAKLGIPSMPGASRASSRNGQSESHNE